MIRPFKTVEELTQETGLCLEKSIVMRTKKADENIELITGIVTGFYTQKKKVAVGASLFLLQELFDNYEYEDKDEWRPFGVVVPEETENKKNAKFKVGHMYKDADKDGIFMVTAKYTSPHDNKTYLIAQRLSLHQIGQIICLISKDENEDEFINRYTVDYRPVKCSAKDEVEKREKEIPLY